MRLDGKVAVVTGGGKGIGRAICLTLADKGADVVVADIDSPAASSTVQKIESLDRKAIIAQTDVTTSDEVKKMVEITLQEFGKIDILVNNAGTIKTGLLVDLKEEDWDQVMNVNAKGAFLCCKAVAPNMIERKEGKIINIASQAGKKGEPYNSVYCASKASIISITQTLALELAPYRINVNAICPGVVETKLMQDVLVERGPLYGLTPKAYREKLIKEIPLGRIEEPGDVAKVVLFLASEYSDYMTGQAINVTGGLISH